MIRAEIPATRRRFFSLMQKIIRHLFCQPHMARRIVVLILSVTIMGALSLIHI